MSVTRTFPMVSKSASGYVPYTVLMLVVPVKNDIPGDFVLNALNTIVELEKIGQDIANESVGVRITLYSATANAVLESLRIQIPADFGGGPVSRTVTLRGLHKHASKQDALWHIRVSVSEPNVKVTLHGLQLTYDSRDQTAPAVTANPTVPPVGNTDTSTDTSTDTNTDTNTDTSMDLVNTLRRRHQAPPLVRDAVVQKDAQTWANHLARNVHRLQHGSGKYGENLYWNSRKLSREDAEEQAIRAWYSEVSEFDWNRPTNRFSDVGHFTALVWRTTKRTGFGIAYDTRNGSTYVCARYDPAGNVWTQQAILANVKPAVT